MSDALTKIKELDAKRAQLLTDAIAQALATAKQTIDDLNELGHNCYLATGKAPTTRAPRTPSTSGTGTRRAGIREEVLSAIVVSGADGISPSGIRTAVGADGKAGAQSVSNALSALKKAGKIADANGVYVTA